MFSLLPKQRDGSFKSAIDASLKLLKSKKSVSVLGTDKSGKSSFLFTLSETLTDSYVPIFFSMKHDLISYVKKNTLAVLSAFEITNAKEFFSLPLLELDKKLSELNLSNETLTSLKTLLLFEHDPHAVVEDVLKQLVQLPALLATTKKKTAVLLVDDADQLTGLKSEKISAEMILEQEGLFVITSHKPITNFSTIELKNLDIEEVRDYATKAELKLEEATLTALYNSTLGNVYYVNYFLRQMKLTGRTIGTVIEDSLENELGVYFNEKLKRLSPKELPILFCMAEHSVNTPSRISKLLNYSQTNVRRFLSIMEEKGFVTLRERGVFEINDPIMKKWLQSQTKN